MDRLTASDQTNLRPPTVSSRQMAWLDEGVGVSQKIPGSTVEVPAKKLRFLLAPSVRLRTVEDVRRTGVRRRTRQCRGLLRSAPEVRHWIAIVCEFTAPGTGIGRPLRCRALSKSRYQLSLTSSDAKGSSRLVGPETPRRPISCFFWFWPGL